MSAETWRTTLAALRLKYKMPTTISYRRLLLIRIAAVFSFTAYACSQAYALHLPGPEPPKPYSPNDSFIITFFVLSAIINIHWLLQLFFEWDISGTTLPLTFGWSEEPCCISADDELLTSPNLSEEFDRDARVFTANLSSAQVRCIPFSIAGNVFMAAWGYAWSNEYYTVSQIMLTANLATNLYAVFMLLHVENDDRITPANYITHFVMKTNTGLAVLYMWKNWGVIDPSTTPSMAEMINSCVIFLLMTVGSGPDPTLGICLLYDLTALISGDTTSELWYYSFHWTSIAVSMCLLIELKLSRSNNFSWLKGFDQPVGLWFHRDRPGRIYLEKDLEKRGNVTFVRS
ncbi:hypothetical protein JR316_0000525 [Psilocybe cubensis]|uniref:Uncharacterized protein n=2 Tax=Psilocybe cubensis TaxID=181762 RepID=A0ACB8HEL6_PSICU|nr:hypothetical protein JR316_0000525 [Psilocybe cubensis]KAH9486460.1 hypothetical protein JR316_0000525 [Psilocybe cubensis]